MLFFIVFLGLLLFYLMFLLLYLCVMCVCRISIKITYLLTYGWERCWVGVWLQGWWRASSLFQAHDYLSGYCEMSQQSALMTVNTGCISNLNALMVVKTGCISLAQCFEILSRSLHCWLWCLLEIKFWQFGGYTVVYVAVARLYTVCNVFLWVAVWHCLSAWR